MFPVETTTLRSRPWPVFLLLAAGITMMIIVPQKTRDNLGLYFGGGFLLLALIFWWIFRKAIIVIDATGLTHKTIFFSKQVIWSNVSKTYIKYHHHGKSGSHYWHFENAAGNPVKFSINLYSRQSLRTLAEAVTMKCKNADIEKRIYNMAEGVFPWYIW